jgi:hypothetical protein
MEGGLPLQPLGHNGWYRGLALLKPSPMCTHVCFTPSTPSSCGWAQVAPHVQFALALSSALRCGHYVKMFELLEAAPLMLAAAAQVRYSAVRNTQPHQLGHPKPSEGESILWET